MSEATLEELAEAIRRTHDAEPRFVETVPVHETFQGKTVWNGIVHVFDLGEHPTATRCYAWSVVLNSLGRRHVETVLHQGRVDSPQTAVQASIVNTYREATEDHPVP